MATKVYTDTVDIIVEMAGYGIGYWATTADPDREERTYTVTEEDGVKTVLTDTMIHKGLRLAAAFNEAAKTTLREYRAGDEYVGGDLGSDDADVIIQMAAFGKLVYG